MGLYLRPCRATGFGVEGVGFTMQGLRFRIYRGTSAVNTVARRSVLASIKKTTSKTGRSGEEMVSGRGTPDLIT
jgi:cobalamin biosynthesis protein CbiD